MTDDFEKELVSYDELLSRELPKMNWIVEDFVPEGKLILLAGARRSFKTWLGLYLFACVSSGIPFLGRNTKKCNVLYLDGENSLYTNQDRLKMIEKGGVEKTESGSKIVSYPSIKLNSPVHIQSLEKIIKKHNIKLIIIDPLRRLFSGRENDAEVMSNLLNDKLKKSLIEKHKVSIFLVHHLKKKPIEIVDELNLLRGSSELENIPDAIFFIEREGKTDIATLKNEKSKFTKEMEDIILKFEIDDGKFKVDISSHNILGLARYGPTVTDILNWILDNNITNFKTGNVKSYFKSKSKRVNPATINNAFKILTRRGFITKISRGNWKVIDTS